ncbi:MAG: RNA polymerase sigma factor [Candidatus Krumholzibacteria bacterium]|nr:RNA polymerase sigma factor [Candidatus Krumholzibacteria bacterium]
MHRDSIIYYMREQTANPSDEEIIHRVVNGDVDVFRYLLERHHARVFGIVGRRVPRRDAEEVAHNAFVRAYTSLSTYERKGDFVSWLSKIAVRACYDYWREKYNRREQPMSALNEEQLKLVARITSDQSSRAHGERASMQEARDLLGWAMDRLSAEDRSVLELVHIEGRSVKEAAELLGWSAVNVKVRAYRSRKKLRAILEKAIAEGEKRYENAEKDTG